MIMNIIIIVVAAPPMDHQLAAEKAYQEIKAINDREEAEYQAKLAEAKLIMPHQIACSCGWSGRYATPGRAKMGLSGHKRHCRRQG